MSGILQKFSFDPSKAQDWKIYAVLAVVWLTVVLCAVGSIFSQRHKLTQKQKLVWILMFVLLPGLGVLIYLPYSFRKEGPDLMVSTKKLNSRSSKSSSANVSA